MDHKYPYTDFHELNLDWFLSEFKKLTAEWLQVQHDWEDEQQAFQDLHDYVQDYFANLNLYQEVHDILYSPEMQQTIQLMLSNITTSQLPNVVANQIASVVAAQLAPVVAAQLPNLLNGMIPSFLPAAVAGEASDWLSAHVDPDTGYVIDDTLSIALAAADAKAVGDKIMEVGEALYVPFNRGKNRVNKEYISTGYLKPDGSLQVQGDWMTTNFCYVHDLADFIFSGYVIATDVRDTCALYFMCTYDKDKNLISQVYTSTNVVTYTVPVNVYYVRISYHGTIAKDMQLESGTTMTKYVNYNLILKDGSLPADISLINKGFYPTLDRVDSVITNNKLIDITSEFTLLNGYVDKSNGVYYPNAQGKSTDYLDIFDVGDVYVSGGAPFASNCLYALYDENQNYIGYYGTGTIVDYHFRWEDILTSYPKARYVRFTSIITLADLVIKRSSTLNEILADLSWTGKKWCCVGDSLTETNSRTTKNYHGYIADKTGITIVNLGNSGRGYKNPGADTKTFIDVMADVPLDSDVVTIFGSGNDLTHGYTLGNVTDSGTTTICGCINETIDALIARFPTVQLGIVAPTPWVSFPPSVADNLMEQYVEALKTICSNRSIPFLDLYHCSNLRPWTAEGRAACYTRDEGNGVHPDETGHKIISSRFEGFLDSLLLH